MIQLANEIDIINVAWLKVNGPLGNVVPSFCKSTKLAVAQPFIDPCDVVNKCAENELFEIEIKWDNQELIAIDISPQITEPNWRQTGAFDSIVFK